MKKTGSVISWTIRIAIIVALLYFLRPVYAPPKATMPASIGANDFVSWTFHNDTNASVVQTLILYGDGRHAVIIKRAIGDPDLPELNAKWKTTRDKATGLSQFRYESALSNAEAKRMLDEALRAGALDLQPEPAAATESLDVQTSFGGAQRSVTGPAFLGQPFDINPGKWINRQRWAKLGNIPVQHPELKHLLAKKQVTLVDDDGKEVKP